MKRNCMKIFSVILFIMLIITGCENATSSSTSSSIISSSESTTISSN